MKFEYNISEYAPKGDWNVSNRCIVEYRCTDNPDVIIHQFGYHDGNMTFDLLPPNKTQGIIDRIKSGEIGRHVVTIFSISYDDEGDSTHMTRETSDTIVKYYDYHNWALDRIMNNLGHSDEEYTAYCLANISN